MIQPWPHIQEQIIDKKIEKEAQSLFEVIKEIRNLRSSLELSLKQKVVVSICAHNKTKENLIKDNSHLIMALAKLETLNILSKTKRPTAAISAVIEDVDIYLHFSGLIDINKERLKIQTRLSELIKLRDNKKARVKDPEFLKRAPGDVVQNERKSVEELENSVKRLERMLNELH